jgi:hypothetical protein
MSALFALSPFYRALNKLTMALFHHPNALPSPRVEPMPLWCRKMPRNASVLLVIKETIRRVWAARTWTNVCRPTAALPIKSVSTPRGPFRVSPATAPMSLVIHADLEVRVWTHQPVLLVSRFPAECNVRPDVSPTQLASTMHAFAMLALFVLSPFYRVSRKLAIILFLHPRVEPMPQFCLMTPQSVLVYQVIKEMIHPAPDARISTNVFNFPTRLDAPRIRNVPILMAPSRVHRSLAPIFLAIPVARVEPVQILPRAILAVIWWDPPFAPPAVVPIPLAALRVPPTLEPRVCAMLGLCVPTQRWDASHSNKP